MKNISENKKPVRREFLFTASYTLGAVGVGAVVWPLIDQMNPDASVKAVSTTEVDIGNIELGKTISTYARPTFLVQSVESIRVHAESIQHRKIVFPVLFTDQITRARRSTG